MFGYAAYSQPAFAALAPVAYLATILEASSFTDSSVAGKAYADSVIETQTIADVGSTIALFSGLISESILSETDSEVIVATFIAYITENFYPADVKTVLAAFNSNMLENITLNDSNQAVATFNKSQTESFALNADAPLGFAWVKIDNTESTQWVLIDNRQ